MSVQTKKRFKNLGKIIGIALFALLTFTNIKVAMMDDTELGNGDISVFGIELNLFVPTYAEDTTTGGGGGGCYTYGDADPTTCTYECGLFFLCTGSQIDCNEGGCICYIQPFCD